MMWLFRSGIVMLVYTGLCVYTGARLFAFVRYFLPGFRPWVFWPVFIIFFNSFILINLSGLDRLRFLRQAGLYSLAVIVYLLLGVALFDAVRLVLWFCGRNLLTRRFSAAGVGVVLCLTALMVIYGALHARVVYTKHYALTIPKQGLEAGFRIALISDLHIGDTVGRAWVSRIVDAVNRAEPDMVFIAGDIFDGNLDQTRDLPGTAAELRRITAPYGVYACLGNHDVDRTGRSQESRDDLAVREGPIRVFMAASGTGRIAAFLRDANITLLEDEVMQVTAGLLVAGRRDARPIGLRPAKPRKSPAELTASVEPANTLIMLDHQPIEFPRIEAAAVVPDLLLCGHTHKGQLFPANLITGRIFAKAGATHYGYWRGKTMQAVVTSGAGLWGPPLRVATNSELAVIDLRFVP
jgi:predicted MPP superfamily phosphohydrolase